MIAPHVYSALSHEKESLFRIVEHQPEAHDRSRRTTNPDPTFAHKQAAISPIGSAPQITTFMSAGDLPVGCRVC